MTDWSDTAYVVTPTSGEPFTIVVGGRTKWALTELLNAGSRGVTPITNPAPRWSAYIRKLRLLDVEVETVWLDHGGDFAGRHGKYVLRSGVALARAEALA